MCSSSWETAPSTIVREGCITLAYDDGEPEASSLLAPSPLNRPPRRYRLRSLGCSMRTKPTIEQMQVLAKKRGEADADHG